MPLKRREFLRIGGAGALLAGVGPHSLFSQLFDARSPWAEQILNEEFPFPYDQKAFECAERVFNVRRSKDDPSVWITDLNLQVRDGKHLDIKVLVADRREDLAAPRETFTFTGAAGPVDVVLKGYDSPRLYYQVQYREGSGSWQSLAPRNFKLPQARLDNGGQIQALIFADDHTFDDAEFQIGAEYAATRISGDYINDFLRNLRTNPNWMPAPPLSTLKFGFALAKAIRYILAAEDPDLVLNLGDTNGIGAPYRWATWGLPAQALGDLDYNYIARTLWLRMRRVFSALTPNVPMYIAPGNHDGDEHWNPARFRAKEWRQKLFPMPDASIYPEGGHQDGNYYALTYGGDASNGGGAQFVVLDTTGFSGPAEPRKIEEWTLGQDQFQWLEKTLGQNDHDWSFVCCHHVLGGWPAGPTEAEKHIVYGRGPLFTAKDYQEYADPTKIEQVKITEIGQKYGLRGILYGHDHIFYTKRIGAGLNNKDLYGICCGSPKYVGETSWWSGAYWQKHYGVGMKSVPDFWGPSGITRLTLKRDQARVDYIVTTQTPYSNLASSLAEGVVVSSLILPNPPPALATDMPSLAFQVVEGRGNPPDQILRVRNGGGRAMRFQVTPKQSWIRVTPESGKSWAAWKDISVSLQSEGFPAGTYEGAVLLESADAANSPLTISVALAVTEVPLYAPLDFMGRRTALGTILLVWRPNRLNTNVLKYRLYLLDDKGGRSFLAEVRATSFQYLFRRARSRQAYRFGVTAVDGRGRESEPAITVVS